MRPSLYGDLDRDTCCTRETPARRIGVIVSFLFLMSLGTLVTLTSVPGGGQVQAGQVSVAALPSAAAR